MEQKFIFKVISAFINYFDFLTVKYCLSAQNQVTMLILIFSGVLSKSYFQQIYTLAILTACYLKKSLLRPMLVTGVV